MATKELLKYPNVLAFTLGHELAHALIVLQPELLKSNRRNCYATPPSGRK